MFRKFAPAAHVISNKHFTLIDIRRIRHHREEKIVAIAFHSRIAFRNQAKISKNRLKRWNGKQVEVIIEDIDSEREVLIGRGPADSPEIDGIVHVYPDQEKVSRLEIGKFSLVEIIGNNEHDLIAKIVGN